MTNLVTTPHVQLQDAVAQATDSALIQIVQLLDGLAYRPGELEGILSSALPRLRSLRPARPMRVNRLIFLPLEGAIISHGSWDIGEGVIPRRALAPILQSLRAGMGAFADRMDADLLACPPADADMVGVLGTALWTEAARLAPELQPPADSILPPADFRGLVDLCARVWMHGGALWELLRDAPAHPPRETLGRVLTDAAMDAEATSVMIATLLYRAAAPGSLARAACDAAPAVSALAEEALDRWIVGSVPDSILVTPAAATDAAAWFDAVTEDLEAAGWLAGSTARRARVQALRQRIDRASEPGADIGAIRSALEREDEDFGEGRLALRGFAALRKRLFGK